MPGLSPEKLESFRRVQQLAYDCAVSVQERLHPGDTERDAATWMGEFLAARGVERYFHKPFAWFGDRTAFRGRPFTPLHFLPTARRLERCMPVILDVAPIVDDCAADIGYSFCLGENERHAQMLADLEVYREFIVAGIRKRRTLSAIYRDVDALIESQGYENRHRAYPFQVLAHRVDSLTPPPAFARLVGDRTIAGFSARVAGHFVSELVALGRGVQQHSGLWNQSSRSDHLATPGLWAVEPHLGWNGIGAKWEELLVVTETDAYWLDDDLPHVRRWAANKTNTG